MEFRKLRDGELAAAHTIIAAATESLNARGIVQWPRVIPLETYAERQARGENFGLFGGGSLHAVMTLAPEVPERWRDRQFATPFLWLSTLAVAPGSKGRGRTAVEMAESWARDAGIAAIYLDCVDRDDALPSFYRSAGYTMLACREAWPGWPMCLLEKILG